ncbi:flavin reductase family protein [Nocardia sp. alder85J]|uniref:flavin reductase family protein n=1 Tax=Nocardia sp. alder85J TaxID=2862949 RepID=UPI001CD6104F|nr:flavin reductase family protein [Nocardia sp. alder85J]MCX4095833.1 flavin reductase family protein [Nocardia sp. alder85J]
MTAPEAEQLAGAFKDAMAAVCTPVAVVTAMDGERPHGTTVSAFASLSMSPPSLLVSLDRGSDLLALVLAAGEFGVNILGHDQSELAGRFARKGQDKFEGVDWSRAHGVPRLAGAPGWFACRVAQAVEAADHVVLMGEVHALESRPTPPLTYFARGFGTHRVLA